MEERRHAPLVSLFGANLVSYAGSTLTVIAIPWYVLQATGSVLQTGITAFFTTVPTVLSSFFGSILVDRLGYKHTSVISDLTTGVSIALIPLLAHTVGLPFWALLLLVFCASLLKTPGETARTSLLPDLAKMAQMSLVRANSLSQGISHIASLVGAPLAGILIILLGSSNLLWIDAATFCASALAIGAIVPARSARLTQTAEAVEVAKRSYGADMLEGLRFILSERVILAILITLTVTNTLDIAFASVGTPVYVRQLFGNPTIIGLISSIFLGCALLGTVIFSAVGERVPRRLALFLGLIILSTRFWVYALFPSLPLVLIISAIAGMASAPVNPVIYTIAYERVPVDMRARVFGVGIAISVLGAPLGVLLFSYLINGIGIASGLLIMGVCYLLVTLGMFLNPGLRTLEKRKNTTRESIASKSAASD